MLKEERNKGITLIALIITIIVLLILAGVTISAITGNESVMEKAQQAKEKTDISSEKEAIQLAVISSMAQNEDVSNIDESQLISQLSNNSINDVEKKEYYYDITGNTGTKYKIIENGTVYTEEELKEYVAKDAITKGYLTLSDPFPTVRNGVEMVSFVIYYDFPDTFERLAGGHVYAREQNLFDISEEDFVVGKDIEGLRYKPTNEGVPNHTLNITDYDYGARDRGYALVRKYGIEIPIYTQIKYGKYSELVN